MAKYDDLSLRELKAAMRDAKGRIDEMRALYDTYAATANTLDALMGDMHSARTAMRDGWKGRAGDAADTAMVHAQDNAHHSRNSSHHMGRLTNQLADSTAYHYEEVEGTPDVDTSMWASMQSSYMNPFMAVNDHHQRVQQATENQRKAAVEARALDDAGQDHEREMKATSWPEHHKVSDRKPPRTLPPRQTVPPIWTNPPIKRHPPVKKPPVRHPGPITTPGPVRHRQPDPGQTTPSHTGPGYGGIGSWTNDSTTPAGLSANFPDIPGVGSGNGLAGAAGLGGGLAGGLAGSGSGEPGLAGFGRGGAADPLAAGSKVGIGSDELAAREAGGVGAAEEAAGSRGLLGGPLGAGGGRRRDDEERRRPDYLEDEDDLWGSGALGVPPVLGEDD